MDALARAIDMILQPGVHSPPRMTIDAKPLGFGHHALAVLGAAMIGSTLLALGMTAWLVIATGGRPLGASWFAMLAAGFWLTAFLFTLPGAGVAFSLLWPVTRRGSALGAGLCIAAGAGLGAVLAPLANPTIQDATWGQIGGFALAGVAVAAIYLLLAKQLRRTTARSDASRAQEPSQLRGSD